MALIDVVTLRVSGPQLVQLTNTDTTGIGLAVNTTILAEAIKSTKAEFFDRTGVTLDDTTPNESHLALGVRGVLYWLKVFRGLPLEEEDKIREAWYAALYAYAKTALGGLNWISPTTDSQLTPSGDSPNGQLVRPRFDNAAFADVEPNAPGSATVDPDAGNF